MTMTAMVILERCRAAEKELRLTREKIARYRDAARRMTSALDGVGGRSSGEADRLAAIAGEIDALERRMKRREEDYSAELDAACRLLDMLPPKEALILYRYYLKRQTLSAVAAELGYSRGYIRNLKGAACARLAALGEGEVLRLLPVWYIIEEENRA